MTHQRITLTVDIEPTNRCNARCNFCPRDQTPHQGLMSPETFRRALDRAVEFRGVALAELQVDVAVSLCGLGEPLLNRHLPDFIRQVRAEDLQCTVSSNGALLDERRSAAILDAGVQRACINVGEIANGYEDVYRLPFERTRDNVLRFAAMAEGRCDVFVVLVDHRGDPDHLDRVRSYWQSQGLDRFLEYSIINRGGALFVDHMQYEALPELALARSLLEERGGSLCGAPFAYLFVGYDGLYYLCCSDWKKQVPLGSVFDVSFRDVTLAKLEHVLSREPICRTCNLDPINLLTDQLREPDPAGRGPAQAARLADAEIARTQTLRGWLDVLDPATSTRLAAGPGRMGRPIPVRSV